jgi:hypothetical protein
MTTKTKRSAATQKRLVEGRAAARERVVARGIVAFRSDPQMMDLLLRVAERKRIPYGVLARSWVMDCLVKEAQLLGIDLKNVHV